MPPFCISTAAPDLQGQSLQSFQNLYLPFQLCNGSGRRRLIKYFLFCFLHFVIRRILEVFNIVRVKGGSEAGNEISHLNPALEHFQLAQAISRRARRLHND